MRDTEDRNSGSRDAWFHATMLLSADTVNIFSSVNQIEFTIKAG